MFQTFSKPNFLFENKIQMVLFNVADTLRHLIFGFKSKFLSQRTLFVFNSAGLTLETLRFSGGDVTIDRYSA